MAKPSTHAEWDTDGTNLTATTGGHKSDGFATNEIPTSGELNHWMNQVANWTEWLMDGSPEASFTTKVLADGDNNDLDLSGVASLVNKTNFYVTHTGGGSTAEITGLAGGYDGKEVVISTLNSDNPVLINPEAAGSLAANRIHMPWVDLGLTGKYLYMVGGASWIRLKYIAGSLNRWVVVDSAFVSSADFIHTNVS
jgi:hypothetical protein